MDKAAAFKRLKTHNSDYFFTRWISKEKDQVQVKGERWEMMKFCPEAVCQWWYYPVWHRLFLHFHQTSRHTRAFFPQCCGYTTGSKLHSLAFRVLRVKSATAIFDSPASQCIVPQCTSGHNSTLVTVYCRCRVKQVFYDYFRCRHHITATRGQAVDRRKIWMRPDLTSQVS